MRPEREIVTATNYPVFERLRESSRVVQNPKQKTNYEYDSKCILNTLHTNTTMTNTVDTVPAGDELDPFQPLFVGDDECEVFGELTKDVDEFITDAFATASITGGSVVTVEPSLSGRPPNMLYLSCDPDNLSPYHVAVRKNIELYEALEIDVGSGAQGRNRPVVLGQIGIRCRFCSHVPPKERARGAAYYPSKLLGVYQAALNLAKTHLCESCPLVPSELRAELCRLRDQKTSAAMGGKVHWAKTTEVLSVHEDENGLRYGHFTGYPGN